MMRRRVKRARGGGFDLRIPAEERELLRSVGPQLREVLVRDAAGAQQGEDSAVARLFPVAYPDDEDRQTEYRLLVHDELLSSHLGALAVLEETADAERLDEDQLLAWMRALNHVRLVLGTRLDVTEEGDERPLSPSDPRTPAFAVYDYLTYLQGEIIEALSG
ncbi:MAG TPA: DUF2017 family protein [Acidimicrobiales bacterium]|nr:DUF2017 family protein [Acidimicrobiales bacterium]